MQRINVLILVSCFYLYAVKFFDVFGGFDGAVVRTRAFHLRSWVGFSLRTHVKKVSQRSAESRGFSLGAPVSSNWES
jgi:hypothetical protein